MDLLYVITCIQWLIKILDESRTFVFLSNRTSSKIKPHAYMTVVWKWNNSYNMSLDCLYQKVDFMSIAIPVCLKGLQFGIIKLIIIDSEMSVSLVQIYRITWSNYITTNQVLYLYSQNSLSHPCLELYSSQVLNHLCKTQHKISPSSHNVFHLPVLSHCEHSLILRSEPEISTACNITQVIEVTVKYQWYVCVSGHYKLWKMSTMILVIPATRH